MHTDNTDIWIEIINQNLADKESNPFNSQKWILNKILQNLTTQEGPKSFIQYKLLIILTQYTISQAIALKFKYKDIAFFTIFIKVKYSKLVH